MLKNLQRFRLPNDDFMDRVRQPLDLTKLTSQAPLKPFQSLVTLNLVQNPSVMEAARNYIVQLIKDKENLGYLYHLDTKPMIMPLDIQLNYEVIVECKFSNEIKRAIDDLAAEMFCRESTTHRITQLELLYFFIRLVNPDLNWITVDHIMQGCKHHAHLIAFKAKQYSLK